MVSTLESTEQNIEKLIQKIFWGKSFIKIDDVVFILRNLTIKEHNYISFIYDEKYKEATNKYSLIKNRELLEIYNNDGTWTADHERAINVLDKEIDGFNSDKSLLKETATNKIKINKIKRKIKLLEGEVNKLTNKKYDYFKDTAENYADQESKKILLFFSLETEYEKSYWKDIENFLEETNIEFINQVATQYYKNCIMESSVIRNIARNPSWRFRWSMCKNDPMGLFGKGIYDLTYDQSLLVYWSQAYDNVYESVDRPPKSVIENDYKLDQWFKNQQREMEKSSIDKFYNMDKGIKPGKVGKNELFVMAHDKDEVADIQELNDPYTRSKIRAEEKTLSKQKSFITEAQLRKRELILQARQARKEK